LQKSEEKSQVKKVDLEEPQRTQEQKAYKPNICDRQGKIHFSFRSRRNRFNQHRGLLTAEHLTFCGRRRKPWLTQHSSTTAQQPSKTWASPAQRRPCPQGNDATALRSRWLRARQAPQNNTDRPSLALGGKKRNPF